MGVDGGGEEGIVDGVSWERSGCGYEMGVAFDGC